MQQPHPGHYERTVIVICFFTQSFCSLYSFQKHVRPYQNAIGNYKGTKYVVFSLNNEECH